MMVATGVDPDLQRQWRAALTQSEEAKAHFTSLAPSHQAAFLEWVSEAALTERNWRIQEAVAILAGQRN
jgi:uncharacterized protein YdeI (YjbR/CyaY-like superfamily)